MDFSKQLANLQRSVSRASASKPDEQPQSGAPTNPNNPSRRYQPYPNHPSRRHDGGRHQFSSDEEYYLPKLIHSIPKYHPVQHMKKEKQRHVAFIFLTIDDLPLQHIWERFFATLSHKSGLIISVIIHAKYPEKVTNLWTKQRLLIYKPSHRDLIQSLEQSKANSYVNNDALPPPRYFSRKPEWGSIDITRAMIDLLDEGLRIGTHRDDTPHVLQTNPEFIQKFSSRRYISNSTMPNFLKDPKAAIPTVDRFVFLSETCMPVCTMDELELSLFGPAIGPNNEIDRSSKSCPYHTSDAEKSWIKAINKPNNGYARQLQWDAVFAIPQDKIWKADQWITLTRRHTWPILSLVNDAVQSIQKESQSFRGDSGRNRNASRNKIQIAPWQCFRKVKASDEMYFPTMMALLGIIHEDNAETNMAKEDGNSNEKLNSTSMDSTATNEVAYRRVTYCDWSMNARNPETFTITNQDEFSDVKRVVRLAREEGCLFARKFVLKGSVSDDNKNESSPSSIITGDQWFEIIST